MEVHTKTTVTISFNGADKTLEYTPHEHVSAALEQALDLFQVSANRHVMALFTEAGAELPDKLSMEAAGVKPGELLYLRQSTVKGG